MKKLFFTQILLFFTLISFGGCGGGSTTSSTQIEQIQWITISGNGNKGPFQKGAKVIAYKLNNDGSRDINKTAFVLDDNGSFSIEVTWSGATEVVFEGEYINENNTSQVTTGRLSGVINTQLQNNPDTQINILTHFATSMIKKKMEHNTSIEDAKKEAKDSVTQLFNIQLSNDSDLDKINLLSNSGDTIGANIQLLELSSALMKTTYPQNIIDQIQNDLEDGTLDENDSLNGINAIKKEIENIDIDIISNNLSNLLGLTPPTSTDKSSILNGNLEFDYNITFHEKYDVAIDSIIISETITLKDIIGEANISILNGAYSINQEPYTTNNGTISNDQNLTIQLRSSDLFDTSTTATVTIGGILFYFSVTTQDATQSVPILDKTIQHDYNISVGESFKYTPQLIQHREDINWSIKNKPSWCDFNETTGVLQGNSNSILHEGAYEDINISVSNQFGSDYILVNLYTNPKSPQFVEDIINISLNENESKQYQILINDTSDDITNFSINPNVDWILVNNETGIINIDPKGNDTLIGDHNYTISVTDHSGLIDTIELSIFVSGINETPQFTSSLKDTTIQEANQTLSFEINASDPDGDHLYISIESQDTNLLSVATTWDQTTPLDQADYSSSLDFNITALANGLATIYIIVDDGDLNISHAYDINITYEVNETLVNLNYLNSIRNNAGLTPFSYNTLLQTSSQNHANYIIQTNEVGHYETITSASNYTGYSPSNRAGYVGYMTYISENLTTNSNDNNYISSIDQLMTAIYHRFGFLDIKYDEIGFGSQINTYVTHVYNMGKTYLNSLCSGESFNGSGAYYYNICLDEDFKISQTIYEEVYDTIKDNSRDIIIWPYEDQNNFQVAFYEETPDPLPDCSVSGNPISIEFNENKIESNITMNSFELYENNITLITNTRILDINSDPNHRLNHLQFVLFPLERLNFDTNYTARFSYIENSTTKEKSWNFKTRDLNYPYFIADANTNNFNIISEKEYEIYLKPDTCNEIFGSLHWSYNTSQNDPIITWIDSNTITIKGSGKIGEYIDINGTNTNKTIRLTISTQDDQSQ